MIWPNWFPDIESGAWRGVGTGYFQGIQAAASYRTRSSVPVTPPDQVTFVDTTILREAEPAENQPHILILDD